MTTQNTATADPKKPARASDFARDLPISAPVTWLKAGVRDTFKSPGSSLFYGLVIFLVTIAFLAALFEFGFSYILMPVIAGFMVLGPMVAIGLYEKSRLLASGAEQVSLRQMLTVKAQSPGQLLFVGLFLMLVMTFWLRAAVMLYALFFGLAPAGGFEETLDTMFFTNTGRTLLLVGSIVGGLLAAFSFALSAFSVPMLLDQKLDTMTAMALSVVIAWTNKPVVFVWGCIVLSLFLLSVATAFIGLILIFPILGHATWHAHLAMRLPDV